MAYVYIIKCNDGSYYTGVATDIKRRIKEHYYKLKNCAKYTRAREVIELSAVWEAENLSTAGKLEYYIKKRLTHNEKKMLIEKNDLFSQIIKDENLGFSYTRISDISLDSCIN